MLRAGTALRLPPRRTPAALPWSRNGSGRTADGRRFARPIGGIGATGAHWRAREQQASSRDRHRQQQHHDGAGSSQRGCSARWWRRGGDSPRDGGRPAGRLLRRTVIVARSGPYVRWWGRTRAEERARACTRKKKEQPIRGMGFLRPLRQSGAAFSNSPAFHFSLPGVRRARGRAGQYCDPRTNANAWPAWPWKASSSRAWGKWAVGILGGRRATEKRGWGGTERYSRGRPPPVRVLASGLSWTHARLRGVDARMSARQAKQHAAAREPSPAAGDWRGHSAPADCRQSVARRPRACEHHVTQTGRSRTPACRRSRHGVSESERAARRVTHDSTGDAAHSTQHTGVPRQRQGLAPRGVGAPAKLRTGRLLCGES